MIESDMRDFAQFRIGDRIRCLKNNQDGVVRGLLCTFPTSNTGILGYQDLTDPAIIYTVQFGDEDMLLWGEDMRSLQYQLCFDFMYKHDDWDPQFECGEINTKKDENKFSETKNPLLVRDVRGLRI